MTGVLSTAPLVNNTHTVMLRGLGPLVALLWHLVARRQFFVSQGAKARRCDKTPPCRPWIESTRPHLD